MNRSKQRLTSMKIKFTNFIIFSRFVQNFSPENRRDFLERLAQNTLNAIFQMTFVNPAKKSRLHYFRENEEKHL